MNEVQRQRRAMEQFDRLGDLDGDAQAAALAILRDEDPALAALVEAMLRVDAQAPVEPADGILHEALLRRIDDDALRAGQPIGPFVLVRALGRGGMGEVWEAVRAEAGFAQRVALKRLHAPASSPVARRRFLRERSILARLEHPAIARLIDGGIEPDGEAWLAIEYVEGEPITEWVRRARPPRAARVTLVEDVCAAVAYAHGRLVLHRDIKPANVLVDDGGRVRLLDFGIARLLDDADGEDTSAGWVPRTPGYAAPEQLRGEPVGAAADVYQLGVLLGEVLFDARLREVPRTRWRQRLGTDLAAILEQATAERVEDRYAGAAALAADLARWRARRPVAARPARWSYRAWRFVARHRLALALGAFALAAAATGIHGTWRNARRAELAQRQAETQAARAAGEAATAQAVGDVLGALFTAADPYASNRRDLTAREVLLDAVQQLQARSGLAPAVRLRLANRIAAALDQIGELGAARPLLEACAGADGDAAERALVLSYLAELQRADGHFDAAREHSRMAVALARAAGSEGRLALVTALRVQASTEAWDHRYEPAVEGLREALPIALGLGPEQGSLGVQVQADLGHFLIYLEQFDEADRHLAEAAAQAASQPARWRALAHHVALSQLYLLTRQRRYADALALSERLLPEGDRLHGADSSNGVQLRQLRARALVGLGRHADAVAAYRAVEAILQRQQAPIARRLENGWFIALTELDGRRYAPALAAAERLLALAAQVPEAAQAREDFVFTAAEAELGLGRDAAAMRRLAPWPADARVERAARLPLPLLQTALARQR
ncbi:MAG: serine/threonine protein kinase [Rhodanobacteraceae bacterium]|jgi:serine/threonine-protein kinase|nr:serine/threonine protein kinase [Rhodanobacteraceae bacterium]